MSSTNETDPKTNEYIDLITLCLLYYFLKSEFFNGNYVETLETQVQARLSLLPSGATSTPRQFRRFCPTPSGYINIHPHTNLYLLYKNNPDQNVIHVLVEKLPGSESEII
ncbi:hypothetical protein F8M41_011646 [Gigaspora margarita]|uniref:Uncharacterized protein n=1 Tax=Gigaspora margarita TaxID=4874 RepID=A0A8H3X0H1_GIGMA|nr:hypothetical protein F8M41_011646 [Gigaspora margarita]